MASPAEPVLTAPADSKPAAEPVTFDPEQHWVLSERVALRPEPFGALAYHFGNRRLTFLKTPLLVTVVKSLADHPSARAAVQATGLTEAQQLQYERALAALANAEVLTCA
jgi:putative mycofactocin binding protein MftB